MKRNAFALSTLLAAGAIAGSLSAQQPDVRPGATLQVHTGYGSGSFEVVDPFATSSEARRLNADRANKAGVIPPPTAGWVLTSAVVVEPIDEFGLIQLAEAYGATSVDAVESAPGFFLVGAQHILAANDLVEVFRAAYGADKAYLDVTPARKLRGTPNDPLFNDQWHLRNTQVTVADCNIDAAWDAGYTGTGSVIGILEGGIQSNHPDYQANYNSTASQSGGTSSHGTSCAGVAAAVANNNTGVVGAAYDGQVSRQYYGSSSTTANAFGYRNDINDIKSNSWGPWDDGTITYLSSVERTALENGVANGRGGLGEIYAWAAGNGDTLDRVEYDPYASSRLTFAIGAIGDLDDRAWYNEKGSSMLTVAHSSGNNRGITTTTSGSGYTSNFGGTSSASPLGAGIIGLILDANPNLTWRDVNHVLVNTARKNDPGHNGWGVNPAGHDVNYNFGFGAMDAGAATALAAAWVNVGPEVVASTGTLNVNRSIPDNNTTGITETVVVAQDLTIEFVELILNVDTPYVGDLEIKLTSPNGFNSILAEPRADGNDDYNNYIFTSVRHWDESSAGTWSLRISDEASGDLATWENWQLKIYGTDGGGGGTMILSTNTLAANQTGIFDVTNGDPNTSTHLYYGKRTGSTFVPALNVTLGLHNAKEPAPSTMSDPLGNANWTFVVPNKAGGRHFELQAAQSGRASQVLPVDVLP